MATHEIEEITRQIDRITFETVKAAKEEPKRTEDHRFGHILVAVDGSDNSQNALEWAVYIAKAHNARVTTILVLPQKHPVHGTTLPAVNPRSAALWSEMIEQEEKVAKKVLDDALKQCKDAGLKANKRLDHGPIIPAITNAAKTEKCDLVITGSHGRRGLQRLMLGSVAEGVRDHVPTSILIARGPPPAKRILLGVDGSEPSRKAGGIIAGLMAVGPSQVHVVHVVHSPIEGLEPEMKEKWYRAAEDLRGPLMEHVQLPKGTWVHYDVHFGHPAEEMVRVAQEDETDLIVVGNRGLSGLQSLVSGSVSRRVSHQAECSVLIVK
jgi:nucleotide-binding universal stress UspA family protein